jgi:polyisoprenoid-binding protein YceI
MRKYIKTHHLLVALYLLTLGYMVSCTHDDEMLDLPTVTAITRGTDVIKLTEGWTFDKTHSNVGWETAYMGSAAMLTGRFNMFGFKTLSFDEANPANTEFEAWVRLNTVNTGEPGRDAGCLLGTFGTAIGKVDEPENLAVIKLVSIEPSKTDKGYIVQCSMTFKGVTKPVTGKLSYSGKSRIEATTPYDVAGLTLEFQMLGKTDFGIVSTSVADKVVIKANAQFKKS